MEGCEVSQKEKSCKSNERKYTFVYKGFFSYIVGLLLLLLVLPFIFVFFLIYFVIGIVGYAVKFLTYILEAISSFIEDFQDTVQVKLSACKDEIEEVIKKEKSIKNKKDIDGKEESENPQGQLTKEEK